MKQIILGLLILFSTTSHAQDQWTWISGDSIQDSKGFYGQKSVANPKNIPSARAYGAAWTDHKNEYLYLFGGAGGGWHNDLWKWNGKNWIWINGDSTKNNFGRYGQKKIDNPNNQPGSRVNSMSWIDSKGNLWLFGGEGLATNGGGELNLCNDLWKWDGVNWTWMSGDSIINQTGNYGQKGVANSTNKPGGRSYATGWIDDNDNLWLYGGSGIPIGIFDPAGLHNDLWKFDGDNWTWMGGDSSFNKKPNRGTIGKSSITNDPGARADSYCWKDTSNNVRLFGGQFTQYRQYADFWQWDGKNWTWYAGDSLDYRAFNPGIKGIKSPENNPGIVRGNIWVDKNNTLWMFGGYRTGRLNMLWRWENEIWTWIAGEDTVNLNGIYGKMGIKDSTNYPGARGNSRMSWIDKNGKLHLFGGYGFDANSDFPNMLNDFWTYDSNTLLNNLNEISLKQVTGYPNPVTDYLYFNEGSFSYEIYNSSGRLTKTGKNAKHVNVTALKSGSYIILIIKDNDTFGYFKFQKINN
jgi:hypothetical protein